MAFSRRNLTLSLGLVTANVRLSKASKDDARTAFRQVCAGQGTDDSGAERTHDPLPIHNVATCDVCGPVDRNLLLKGAPQGDGFVVVTQEEVQELREEYADYKKQINIQPHPVDTVNARTVAKDKMYYLAPDGGGSANASAYALIRDAIAANPDLAFMARYTVTARSSLYRLVVRDDAITLEERTTEGYEQPPEIDAQADPQYMALVEQILPNMTTPFDPSSYEDAYENALSDLIASRETQAGGAAPTKPKSAPAKGQDALLAALQQMVSTT